MACSCRAGPPNNYRNNKGLLLPLSYASPEQQANDLLSLGFDYRPYYNHHRDLNCVHPSVQANGCALEPSD